MIASSLAGCKTIPRLRAPATGNRENAVYKQNDTDIYIYTKGHVTLVLRAVCCPSASVFLYILFIYLVILSQEHADAALLINNNRVISLRTL